MNSLAKEITEHKATIEKLQGERSKLQGVIKTLEKDIQGLKKEMLEREETISDKVSREGDKASLLIELVYLQNNKTNLQFHKKKDQVFMTHAQYETCELGSRNIITTCT